MKVLLIDDSIDIGELVTVGLKPYTVRQAFSIAEADEILKQDEFQAILIDVLLPDGNGLELCHRLAGEPRLRDVPKLVLTGLNKTSEIVYGFSCGADDYLTKPFSPIELKARIDRYFREKIEDVLVKGDFHFDLGFQKCLLISGNDRIDLQLTPTEFRIFLLLAKSEGQVVSRRELEESVWNANQTFIKARGIDTHIAHLRKKLGERKASIVSIYGTGYAFRAVPTPQQKPA